jgi:phosphatidylglycerophosphate synthase
MEKNRRPIAARSSALAQVLTDYLVSKSVSPNQISISSIPFAILGAVALLYMPGWIGHVFCAVAIQLRLLCNLLDGMVAIKAGKSSDLGALFNEFPDRVADSVLIVALGYAAGWSEWGWLGALAAALTAYIRLFGGSIGLTQDFRGPMAKQHRMAIMTVACLLGAVEGSWLQTNYVLRTASVMIALGSFITCYTRTIAIARQLRKSR